MHTNSDGTPLKERVLYYTRNMPEIETERLILTKILPCHAGDMFEYSSNPKTCEYLTWSAHKTLRQTENHIKHLQKQYDNSVFFDWGIIYEENGKFIGTAGFSAVDTAQNSLEIGYVVSPSYQGMGIATEAARALIDFAFSKLGVSKIKAVFMDGNTKSERVMQKCNMMHEATHKNSMFIKGSYKTVHIYSLANNTL